MEFKQWLERTLYHGTVIDNKDSIEKYGIDPEWHDGAGPFIKGMYGSNYLNQPTGVFLADKKDLDKSLTAIVYHISIKLNKDFHSVTDNDIRNHGMLAIFHDAWDERGQDYNHSIEKYDPYYRSDVIGAEDNDYISQDNIKPDKIVTGSALIRLMRKLYVWPRKDFGWTMAPDDPKSQKVSNGIKRGVKIKYAEGRDDYAPSGQPHYFKHKKPSPNLSSTGRPGIGAQPSDLIRMKQINDLKFTPNQDEDEYDFERYQIQTLAYEDFLAQKGIGNKSLVRNHPKADEFRKTDLYQSIFNKLK